MGSVNTKLFKEVTEEEQTFPAVKATDTPLRCMDNLLDPRSPSEYIARTPIQVDVRKVHEEELIQPVFDPVLDDPRSPTAGISRTPIYLLKKKFSAALDLSESPLVAPTLDDEEDEVEDVAAEETGGEGDAPAAEVESATVEEAITPKLSPEPTVKDDAPLIPTETKECPPSSPKQTKSQVRRRPKTLFKVLPQEDTTSPTTPKSKDSSQRDHKRSPLSVISDKHSPLNTRNIDINSPRVIVQRKQATKVFMMKTQVKPTSTNLDGANTRSPAKYKNVSKDKENMSF